jgi:hypothetical protein
MIDDVAILRAAGLTDSQILHVIEIAQKEKKAHRREQNRKAKQKQRSRQQVSTDMLTACQQKTADIKHEQNQQPCQQNSADDVPIYKTQSQRRVRDSISIDWRPNSNGLLLADKAGLAGEDLEEEIERFRNHYLSTGKECQDWNPCWANWLISPYRKGKSNGSYQQARPESARERNLNAWDRIYQQVDRHLARPGGLFDQENVTMFPAHPRC